MREHILLYTDDPGFGGVAQYNHTMLKGLVERDYHVTCVQSNSNNPLVSLQKELGIHHLWLEFDTVKEFGRTLTNRADAERIFTDYKPDLVIFSDSCPLSNFAAKQVAIELGIPYIVVIGFVAPYLAERFAAYLNELSRQFTHAKAVIAVSTENLTLLHDLFRLPKDKGQVIYYGRPEQYFAPLDESVRKQLRQEFGIPLNAVVCFTAARLEAVKGYQYQLEAIKQLQQSEVWNKLYFVWAGAGSLEAQLRSTIEKLGASDQVKILGQRWDIQDWLDASDIFVLPSEAEGMPLCIMEAMAKGLPVVASAVSGIPEELGDTGKLLPNPKVDSKALVEELVTTIQLWAADSKLCYSVGQAARVRAEEMFKEARMVQETVEEVERGLLPDGDYISPGFSIVRPDKCFPNMIIGDKSICNWSYLRREVPHNWYVDKRQPTVGFLNRDEAHILYNTALKFKGERALEIGCWLGWSACHLALAGVELDVVDPLLSRPEFYESVSSSLEAAGVLDSVNLMAGCSPQKVEEIAAQFQRKWSLIFIDGNHDAPGPLNDAVACEQFAEDDALILFHDLASPDVVQGLDYLQQKGWSILVYQTMQIMGVAWRGNIKPVRHQPDLKFSWSVPTHLQNYYINPQSKDFSKLKITFCTYDDPNFTGGPNSWLRRLLPALQLAGINVKVLFFTTTNLLERCPCFKDLHDQGIECQAFQWQSTTDQKIHWLLSKLAEDTPDIFVPNMLVAAFYASRWVREAGIPTVGVLHSDDEFHRNVLENFVLGEESYQLSALVCISKFLEQYVRELLQTNRNRITDSRTQVRRISYGVTSPQKLAHPPWKRLKLMYVGRLEEEQKRISEVTRALCCAVREVSDVEAVIVGDGLARANVKRILAEEGKDLPIKLLGLINNSHIQNIMAEHHVLVLLSDYEGLGYAVIEAMACGLVPICLRIRCGIPELVENNVTGLLVNNREDEFVNAIRYLKNNPELWMQMSRAAVTKVKASYSNEICTAKRINLFKELYNKSAHKKNIGNPQCLNLPPVNPAFAREDYRQSSSKFIAAEFKEILTAVQAYTLIDEGRLFSLYSLAKKVCLEDIPGNFVECGTCRGGSAALLATVIKRYSSRPRRLYAFDTFEGMPAPTKVDRHNGIPANLTDKGEGTLKAPIAENLAVICQVLNVGDIIVPVKGLFSDTLPQYKSEIGDIAFLHADSDWYESTMDIFDNLYEQIVPNGLVQIDDYDWWEGCRKAVHDFENLHGEFFDLRKIKYSGVWFKKHRLSEFTKLSKRIYKDIRQYQQNSTSQTTLVNLQQARHQIASQWVTFSAEQLENFSGIFARIYHLLNESEIKYQSLTDSEQAFIKKVIQQVSRELETPKSLQSLLVSMLYHRADQLSVWVNIQNIPDWLLVIYLKYLLTPPQLFREVREADKYYRYMQRCINDLHNNIFDNPSSNLWQNVALLFVQNVNFVPLYFNKENLKDIYAKRGDIIEFALKVQGHQLNYVFTERSSEQKKIRLGILAAHFQPSTETFHTLPAYKHLHWNKFETILYTINKNNSRLERYCAGHADTLVTLPSNLQNQVQAIRDANLDILLIATNVTAVANHIALLATHKLARIQVAFGSCPTTTGIRNIDYFISGSLSEPVSGAQEHYREKLVTVDGVGYCFDYPQELENPTTKPTRENWDATEKTVVFTSGANLFKLIPEVRETWAKVLAAVPSSILVLYPFAPSWSKTYPAASFLTQMHVVLDKYNVSTSRLIILDALPSRADVKEVLKLADVYLDSYRHSGGHSLVDALEVNLPTVVMEGDNLRSRHAAAYLRELQISDLITDSEEAYVQLAIALGTNPELRKQKSEQIKQAMQNNPSFLDSRSYSAKMGAVFQELFQKYQADALLKQLNLRDINFIIFPNWSAPEEELGLELQQVVKAIALHPNPSTLTLLVDTTDISEEDANLLLSGVAMNLMMEEDVEVSDDLQISLVGKLSTTQWQTLLPRLQARIVLEHENQTAMQQAEAESLTAYPLDSLNQLASDALTPA